MALVLQNTGFDLNMRLLVIHIETNLVFAATAAEVLGNWLQ